MERFLSILFLTSCITFCAYASFFCGIKEIDRICLVNFNLSLCAKKHNKIWKTNTTIRTCFNKTKFDTNGNRKNISWGIIDNCKTKCLHEFYEYNNRNGTFNLVAIAKKVGMDYTLYSNATTKYVQKVVDMAIRCAKEAEKAIEAEKNQLDNCKLNCLFDDCYLNLTVSVSSYYDIAEICAAQGTIIQPEISKSALDKLLNIPTINGTSFKY